jgi:uncharacterized protein YbbC (DUF1343 family)
MKKLLLITFFLSMALNIFAQESYLKARKVLVGADLLLSENFDLIKGKKLGVIVNQTAFLASRKHLIDSLINRNDIEIKVLYIPEINNLENEFFDQSGKKEKYHNTQITVYRLYPDSCKFTKEMLKDVDVLLYDIQDIGTRFSPFISILYHSILAAADNNIPIIVLDRPDPIGGLTVEGPIQKNNKTTIRETFPIPIIYGMTTGELADMLNDMEIIDNNRKAELTVIKMKNWERGLYYDKCNIKWIKSIPFLDYIVSVILYPGINLFEGVNISVGKGTLLSFLYIGAPYINSDSLLTELRTLNLSGIEFSKSDFTPVDIPGVVVNPKYKNQLCHGIKLSVTNRYRFDVIDLSINLMCILKKMYGKQFRFDNSVFDNLAGDEKIRKQILSDKNPEQIISGWQKDLEIFKNLRNKFLLY